MGIGKRNSRFVVYDQNFKKDIKKAHELNTAPKENQFASELHMAGRNAYFKEYFHGIKPENQEFPQIGPFENIRETTHFKEGYHRGMFLVSAGIIPTEYQNVEKHR